MTIIHLSVTFHSSAAECSTMLESYSLTVFVCLAAEQVEFSFYLSKKKKKKEKERQLQPLRAAGVNLNSKVWATQPNNELKLAVKFGKAEQGSESGCNSL